MDLLKSALTPELQMLSLLDSWITKATHSYDLSQGCLVDTALLFLKQQINVVIFIVLATYRVVWTLSTVQWTAKNR